MALKRMKALSSCLLMTVVLAACAGENEPKAEQGGASVSPTGSPAGNQSGPTTLNVMTINFGDVPNKENNQAKKWVEEKANVKLNIDFVPSDAYADKLGIALTNSKELDLILFENKSEKYVKLVKQGAFHDLTKYIAETENLKLAPKEMWDNTAVNGKQYGIPRPRGLYGGGQGLLMMRKDWLDRYQLPVPKTVEEFTQALEVFKKNDPAGGGKTIPYTVAQLSEPNEFVPPFTGNHVFTLAHGLPNLYEVQNGVGAHTVQKPEYKTYLEWMRGLWDKGLIDKDAPILKTQQAIDKFNAGVAGAIVGHVGYISDSAFAKLKANGGPNAEVVFIPDFTGASGKGGTIVSLGYYGLWAIPSHVPEAKVKEIIRFLDWTASQEGEMFSKTGVVGVHSDGLDAKGVAVRNDAQKQLTAKEIPTAWILVNRYDPYIYAKSTDPAILSYQKETLDKQSKIGVVNPFLAYVSETVGQNPDYMAPILTASLKYVMGETDYAPVQKAIDDWSKGVGGKILNEYMQAYKEDHK